MSPRRDLALALGVVLSVASVARPQATHSDRQDDPRYGLLTPLPDQGGVPPIVDMMHEPLPGELAHRAKVRRYAKQIRRIRHEHFGDLRVERLRAQGIEELGEFTDPAAFMPMIRELSREKDDVRLAMLEHFAAHGEMGQAALAWVNIYDHDPAIRSEALRRMTAPASPPVLRVLDTALRSPKHTVANNAGMLAGALKALRTIPLLIFAQATADEVEEQGDLAWIAIQTQRAFVARLEAVVDNGVVVFRPIPGVVNEGVIMRVVDAVVVNYRTDVHRSLVAMTSDDWGRSTEHLAYDMRLWWQWYNTEYVPFKNEQARLAEAEAPREGDAAGETGP